MGLNEQLKDTSSGENNFGNEGLPVGAKRFAGLRTTQVLKQMWSKQISFYNETKILPNASLTKDGKSLVGLEEFMIEVSDTNSEVFKGKLHPEVEGKSWFRGFAVQVDMNNPSNKVIILSGWIDSSIENTSLPPVVYIVGNIPPQTIFKIARKYTMGVNQLIDQLRRVHPLK